MSCVNSPRPEWEKPCRAYTLLAAACLCCALLLHLASDASGAQIKAVVLNQALGYGVNPHTGAFYPMDALAAGKTTGVFVDMSAPVLPDASGETQYVRVERQGREVARMAPDASTTAAERLSFTRGSGNGTIRWTEGAYTIVAVADQSSLKRTVSFENTGTLRVLAVPIRAVYDGDVMEADASWQHASAFAQKVFPLADNALVWIPYAHGKEAFVANGTQRFNLNTPTGRRALWRQLAKLQTPENPYDLIVGFVPKNMRQDQDGPAAASLAGYTFGDGTVIISQEDPAVAVTVAHELSHCFAVGDEYEGGSLHPEANMPPFGMRGYHFVTGQSTCGSSPHITGAGGNGTRGTGTFVGARQFPYDAGRAVPLGARSSYMGLSGFPEEEYWVTPSIWEYLHEKLRLRHRGRVEQTRTGH